MKRREQWRNYYKMRKTQIKKVGAKNAYVAWNNTLQTMDSPTVDVFTIPGMASNVHDEGQHNVIFREGQGVEAVAKQVNTTLMAFFDSNKTNPAARHIQFNSIIYLKYQDFPKHFTFRNGKWNGRKRPYELGVNRLQTICRTYSVSPNQGARFYIRLNLNHITGATSFTDLRTYNGTVYGTYKEGALAMVILADDKEWFTAMEETSSHAMHAQMRPHLQCCYNTAILLSREDCGSSLRIGWPRI